MAVQVTVFIFGTECSGCNHQANYVMSPGYSMYSSFQVTH